MKKSALVGLAFLLLATTIYAAATYPAPALGGKDGVITSPAANYKLTREADNTITSKSNGEYNYDDAWAFKSITIVNYWQEAGGNLGYGPYTSMLAPEASSVAVLSKWKATVNFTNLPANTDIYLSAILKITKGEETKLIKLPDADIPKLAAPALSSE